MSTNAPTDLSDYLLVPLNVQALVVNDQVLSKTAFQNSQMNYNNLAMYQTPAPAPLDTTATKPGRGVHLHWDLPAAFKHADSASADNFPLVPNRWLILRFWPGAGTQPRQLKAWVLMSDQLGDADGSPFVSPTSDPSQPPVPTTIGASELLEDWSGDGALAASPASLFLRAVGPGDISFAAFRPNVGNVFSFVDDGTDNQGNPLLATPGSAVDLSYLVAGWFSAPAADPLNGANTAALWAEAMGGLQWLTSVAPYAVHAVVPVAGTFSVEGYGDVSTRFPAGSTLTVTGSTGNDGAYTVTAAPVYSQTNDAVTITVSPAPPATTADGWLVPASAPATWPTRTLTHGMLYAVTWQNSTLPPRPNSSATDVSANVQVALGNSSIDALAAMVVHQSQNFLTPYPIVSVDAGANALTLSSTSTLGGTFPVGSLFTVRNGANDVASFHVASTTFDGAVFTIYTQEPLATIEAGYVVVAADLDAELLEAFQYNLLPVIDQAGGAAKLEVELRKPWFAHAPGGTLWELIPTPREQTADASDAPAPSPEQLQWLAALNFYQHNLDRETRVLQTMQDDLYALWWKVQRINVGYQPANLSARAWQNIMPLILTALPAEAGAVVAQQSIVADWQAKIDALAAVPPSYVIPASPPARPLPETVCISTYKKPNPDCPLTLKDGHMPRLYQPNDPVLLVSGLNPSLDLTNPTAIGQDFLACRFAAEVISALTVSGTAITAAQVRPLVTLPNNPNLPSGLNSLAQALSLESVFLNPNNAPLLATLAGGIGAPVIAGAIRAGKSFTGLAPDESAALPWQQSWVPLFIDWAINWYPTVAATTTTYGWGPWTPEHADWAFNGQDYAWQGGDVTAQGSTTSVTFPIQSATPAGNTLVIRGAGNLNALFPAAALFTIIPAGGGQGGQFTVASASFAAPDFTLVTNEPLPATAVGGQILLQRQLGAGPTGVTYTGRTFLTPKATFNFRSRLQQYLDTHKDTDTAEQLREVQHLIDMIGGSRYAIQGVNTTAPCSILVSSQIDLTHLFPAGSPCYIVGASTDNNGVYTVASASYDGTTFTVVVQETIPSPSPDFGSLVPEPHDWDFLSQSLTGFTDRTVMRVLQQNMPPSGKIGAYDVETLVGQQNQGVPDVGAGDGNSPTTAPPYFFPVRGGFFALRKLYIVDRFGQSIDLLFANGNQADPSQPDNAWLSFAPVRSRWLAPATAETGGWNSPYRLLRLPPRVPTSSRLDFRFVSAPDAPSTTAPAGVDVELLANSDPVCGWFLPNHLDDGLTVYDSSGEMLGEVLLRQVPGANPTIDWFPAPNSANPVVQPTAIPNPWLRGIITGLFNLPAQGGKDVRGLAFENFLKAIDETLWTVDPLGGRSDQSLSVLIGRPLAVLRARLRLTASGHPAVDQTTQFSAPLSRPLAASDAATRTFSVTGITPNFIISLSARFQAGGTFSVSGSAANDGVYHIADTAYSPATQTFTITVLETISSAAAGGNVIASAPDGGIGAVPFSVRLGRSDLFDDGLIGYFLDADYAHFNNVHDPADYQSVGYLTPVGQNGNYIPLKPFPEITQGEPPASAPVPAPLPGSTFVTLLADPRGSIHADTGILPTKDIALPAEYFEDALARMEVTFRTGPLLVEPQAIRIPRPSERNGRWSWIQKNEPGADGWEESPINKETAEARLSATPLVLRDGWMKLSDADLMKASPPPAPTR